MAEVTRMGGWGKWWPGRFPGGQTTRSCFFAFFVLFAYSWSVLECFLYFFLHVGVVLWVSGPCFGVEGVALETVPEAGRSLRDGAPFPSSINDHPLWTAHPRTEQCTMGAIVGVFYLGSGGPCSCCNRSRDHQTRGLPTENESGIGRI